MGLPFQKLGALEGLVSEIPRDFKSAWTICSASQISSGLFWDPPSSKAWSFLNFGEAAKLPPLPAGAGPQLSVDRSSPCCWDGSWSLWRAVWRWKPSVWQAALCSDPASPTVFKQKERKTKQNKTIFSLLKCCCSHKDAQQGNRAFVDLDTQLSSACTSSTAKNAELCSNFALNLSKLK